MFRLLFARRADWAAFTIACVLSLSLMMLGRGPQARAVWFIQHLFVLFYEEPALKQKFGPEYEAYLKTVPRWLPKRPK